MSKVAQNRNPYREYHFGERCCPICDISLPSHRLWLGAGFRFCMSPACKTQVKSHLSGTRYIEPTAIQCGNESCNEFVPEGRYATYPSVLTCSPECCRKVSERVCPPKLCVCGCRTILKWPNKRFANRAHFASFKADAYLSRKCKSFRPLVDRYMSEVAQQRYKNPASIRSGLAGFFEFLVNEQIKGLEEITPLVISNFIARGRSQGKQHPRCISTLSVFFKWAICVGLRTSQNPVQWFLHGAPRVVKQPRPIEDQELNRVEALLNERGNARLRFIFPLQRETGMRICEICDLRWEDFDIDQRRVFIRDPKKGGIARVAFFSHRTVAAYRDWVIERGTDKKHRYLIHSEWKRKCTPGGIRREFYLALCKTYNGRKVNETGLEHWRGHRLRHTAATRLYRGGATDATVMAALGWLHPDSMAFYVELANGTKAKDFIDANVNVECQSLPREAAVPLSFSEVAKFLG